MKIYRGSTAKNIVASDLGLFVMCEKSTHAQTYIDYQDMVPSLVVAFCPGHISGYFRRIDGPTLMTTGSIGAGIVITEGVRSTVIKAERITVTVRQFMPDGSSSIIMQNSPLISDVLHSHDVGASVITDCRLPIGAGFGLSAAALVSTLMAVDRMYDLGFSTHNIAAIAHEAEVTHRTGLGDVASSQGGGLVFRKAPGIDADINRNLDFTGWLYAISLGPIHTPSVLGSHSTMARITAAFPEKQPKNIFDFFSLSRRFTDASGLATPEVITVLSACESHYIPASMTMLGNGVFAYGKQAYDVLSQFGSVYRFGVARSGPEIIEVVP